MLYIPLGPDTSQRSEALRTMHGLSNAQIKCILSIASQPSFNPNRMFEGDASSPGEMCKLMLALRALEPSTPGCFC